MKIISWSIEGLARNIYNLDHFLSSIKTNLGFMSEPQVFMCDVAKMMTQFDGAYKFALNSEDSFDLDLSLDRVKAKGGTMAMWDTNLDQYVTVLKTTSPAVLPLLVKIPGLLETCHIGVYMPTAGLDEQFVEALSILDTILCDVQDTLDEDLTIFIRGDMNVSEKNVSRIPHLSHIKSKFNLKAVPLLHPSYHHFIGDGEFDSSLDVLLHSKQQGILESLIQHVCKHDHPLVLSQHDLLLSQIFLPEARVPIAPEAPNAPKACNYRAKIKWSETGILDYQTAIGSGPGK